jgi:hypothetical protein
MILHQVTFAVILIAVLVPLCNGWPSSRPEAMRELLEKQNFVPSHVLCSACNALALDAQDVQTRWKGVHENHRCGHLLDQFELVKGGANGEEDRYVRRGKPTDSQGWHGRTELLSLCEYIWDNNELLDGFMNGLRHSLRSKNVVFDVCVRGIGACTEQADEL